MTDTNETTKTTETSTDFSTPQDTSAAGPDELIGKSFPAEPIAPGDKDLDLILDDEDEEEKVVVDESLTPIETFEELELSPPLMEAIQKIGWTKPTLIQGLCLPLTTQGQDLAGFAQTGTGKTGVFLITIAHQLLKMREAGTDTSTDPKAIILAPTRELAMQISADAEQLFEQLNISCMPVFGGVDYDKQAQRIKAGIDVIVATPGRLKDYYQKRVFSAKDCCLFICDEADRMLDMGFIEDVEFFLSKLSPETQKMLFSATTNDKVKELAFEYLENPKYISANPETMTPENIEQFAVICDSTQKLRVMLGLLRDHAPHCAIIFTNTKMVAEWLQYKLNNNGIEVDIITGDLPQKKRIALIQRIKNNEVKALIGTDVASRGLHISGITHVYNFDLPDDAANYVHRIGRTARAGASGAAYSLVCEDYGANLFAITKYLGENIPIHTQWFPENYLEIEDKAGNPYKDPIFRGNRMKDEEARGGRPKSGRPQGKGRGDSQSQESRDGRPRRGGRRGPEDAPRRDAEAGLEQNAKAGGEARPPRSESQKGKQGGGRQPRGEQKGPQHGAAQGQRNADRPRPHKKAHMGDANSPSSSPRPPRVEGQKLKIIAPELNTKPAVATKAEVPNTLLGLFKKIFSVFFKRKK